MLRSREAARMIGISPRTLAKWRQKGVGPQCVRLGYNLVIYRLSDIDAWTRTRARSAPKAIAADLEGTIGLDRTGGPNSLDHVPRLRGDRTIKTGGAESEGNGMKKILEDMIIKWHQCGYSVEEIHQGMPQVTIDQIRATIIHRHEA